MNDLNKSGRKMRQNEQNFRRTTSQGLPSKVDMGVLFRRPKLGPRPGPAQTCALHCQNTTKTSGNNFEWTSSASTFVHAHCFLQRASRSVDAVPWAKQACATLGVRPLGTAPGRCCPVRLKSMCMWTFAPAECRESARNTHPGAMGKVGQDTQ